MRAAARIRFVDTTLTPPGALHAATVASLQPPAKEPAYLSRLCNIRQHLNHLPISVSDPCNSRAVGIADRPSRARQDSAATLLALVSASSSGRSSNSWATRAPWKTSPAPSVP